MKPWYLYMIRCRDNNLYTGIANDVGKRFAEHVAQGSRCAKYLRGKSPLQLVYSKKAGSKSDALVAEYRLKQLSKNEKELLVAGRQRKQSRTAAKAAVSEGMQ